MQINPCPSIYIDSMAIIALKPYANESLPVLQYKLYYACPLPGFRSQIKLGLSLRKFLADRKNCFVIDRLRKVQKAY